MYDRLYHHGYVSSPDPLHIMATKKWVLVLNYSLELYNIEYKVVYNIKLNSTTDILL